MISLGRDKGTTRVLLFLCLLCVMLLCTCWSCV